MAQEIYESPYVHEGTTFQIEIPEGLIHPESESRGEKMMICVSDTNGRKPIYPGMANLDMLILIHAEANGKTLENILPDLISRLDIKEDKSNVTFSQEPIITEINDRRFCLVGLKGDLEGVKREHHYVACTIFGDYFVMATFISTRKIAAIPSLDDFIKFVESFKVIDTEKENEFLNN